MTVAVKEIRALVRGVKVVETLCRRGACSLADLHHETGLSKSTLRRILLTLEQATFLRCSLGDGLYRANIVVPAFPSAPDASPFIGRILAAAKPVLAELSVKASWPTDLMVRNGLQLRIVETNRLLSPFPVNRLEIGDHVDMLASAVGRAYLAFCPQAERAEIIRQIRRKRSAELVTNLPRILAETRERGYGVRAPNCVGGTQQHPSLIDNLFTQSPSRYCWAHRFFAASIFFGGHQPSLPFETRPNWQECSGDVLRRSRTTTKHTFLLSCRMIPNQLGSVKRADDRPRDSGEPREAGYPRSTARSPSRCNHLVAIFYFAEGSAD